MNDTELIIRDALNGKLRTLVEVCNCSGDRMLLARLLAQELNIPQRQALQNAWRQGYEAGIDIGMVKSGQGDAASQEWIAAHLEAAMDELKGVQ